MSKNDKESESNENEILKPNQSNKSNIIKTTVSTFFPTKISELKQPKLESTFESLPSYERVPESLKYTILSLEYSLSPRGGLRQWIKVNLSLLLLFGIPTLMLIPLLMGVSNIVGEVANITDLMYVVAMNIFKFVLVVLATGTTIYFANKFIQEYLKSKKSNDSNGNNDVIDVTPDKD